MCLTFRSDPCCFSCLVPLHFCLGFSKNPAHPQRIGESLLLVKKVASRLVSVGSEVNEVFFHNEFQGSRCAESI